MAKTSLKKKRKVEGISLPNFKTYHIATVIKIMQYWQTDRHIGQENRIKSPEIDSHKYFQWILMKVQKR